MALPENDEVASPAPQYGLDDTYDAVKTGLTQARPDAAADMDAMMAEILPELADLSVEDLDSLLQAVKFLNDNPQDYAKNIAQMIAEDIIDEGDLPADYDPEFLAALLTILMEAKRSKSSAGGAAPVPMTPQGFARGGIAEAARLVASQGRNGDTMLAHITPEEARMLRRRGGSGTINPQTGLREYFNLLKTVKKTFKKVVGVAKKVLSSPIGRIIATVGLTMIGVPAPLASMLVTKAAGGSWKDSIIAGATTYLGGASSPLAPYTSAASGALGITSAAGQAALSQGLVGTGVGLLTGQKLSDAVKSGITSATMAAATTGAQQMFPTPVNNAPVDNLGTSATSQSPAAAPVDNVYTPTDAAAGQTATTQTFNAPTQVAASTFTEAPSQFGQPSDYGAFNAPPSLGQTSDYGSMASQTPAAFSAPAPTVKPYVEPTMGQAATNMGQGIMQMLPGTEGTFSSGMDQFSQGAGEMFSPGPTAAQTNLRAEQILSADKTGRMTYTDALKAASNEGPGIIRSYGPTVAAGIGATALLGGFTPGTVPESTLNRGTPGQDLINADPSKYLVQNLPGVKYDERGNITGSSPINYNIAAPEGGGAPMSSIQYRTPSLAERMPTYASPMGAAGGQQGIMQPYNTSDMYGNIMQPQMRAYGGEMRPQGIASLASGGYPRRTGQISGPGTEKSDDIPAMLSDGEFVMTAKAVRGAGKGSRRAGAKQMYALMHQLEKNASRG